ncbi:hypothetical protein DFR86_01410 [Acidianus sulfidivorans JP7]|uniref:Uncharacterized protein n=1 Tax=Acidianus sulfidivorans JP7 TaxID=619593 RepID=A0A2U9IJY3_9CREN|nr:hypothetical protein [Acidianus sulfidivorans]AWR96333.1 hypothetical protein DFR86_01410 [Acidianus sulfidivorans JP7]
MFRFDKLCKASQIRILEQARINEDYAKLVAYHVGLAYPKLDEDIKNKAIENARKSEIFYSRFIEGIKQTLSPKEVEEIKLKIERKI